MSNKTPKGAQEPQTKGQIPPNVSKQGPSSQGVPTSPCSKQQLNPFNARGKNANFAQSGMCRQMDKLIRNMAINITALRKENAELKAKLAEKQKEP
jgi:hypothetical protein